MARAHAKLYKLLQREASAPEFGFERFAVGRIETIRTRFITLITKMMACEEPSQVRLILGANGTGKTLLNNAIRANLSGRNLTRAGDDRITDFSFQTLFSRITFNESAPNRMGIEFARHLRRTLQEPPNLTYASIATRVVDRFTKTYKPPLHIRLASVPFKYTLTKAVKKYEESLEGLFSTDEVEPVVELLDRAYEGIQKRLSKGVIRDSFERYSDTQRINGFLKDHFLRKYPLSIERLNQSLYNDLTSNEGIAQPADTVRALADIGKAVDCKLLVLMIDDFNPQKPPASLLPLLDSINDFSRPKLLLIISSVEEIWRAYERSNPTDKSFIQRLGQFGNPEVLKAPTSDEIRQLLEKLISLMNSELADDGKTVEITGDQKQDLIETCPTDSYRTAIKHLIDQLENHIRT